MQGRVPTASHREGAGSGPLAVSPALSPPLESLNSPVWLLDRKGAVVGANLAARTLEAEAGHPLPLQTPSARELLGEASELRRALDEGRPLEVCVRGPGTRRRLRVVLEPLSGSNGSPQGGLLLIPGSAGRARSLFSRVLAATARELQASLGPLQWFSRLARRAAEAADPARAELYLERIERHERRIEYVVDELHDLVETLAGEIPLKLTPFDMVALVRRRVDEAAGSREHLFEIVAPAEAVVVADQARVGRVLVAMLSNAVRFSPTGGRIRVELMLGRACVTLAVTDPGAGIPEGRLAELFDGPCWDQEAPTGGLGLALYLARETIERHGGTIVAERAAEGGARVTLTLPRVCRG